MLKQKKLFMLIGPKGSGKTHIGDVIDRNTNIHFLRVEPIWLTVRPGEDGWKIVEQAIDDSYLSHDLVLVESLGVGDGFLSFHSSLSTKYDIKMIHVIAKLDTCLKRVKSRDNSEHISVSDDQVEKYNRAAAAVTYDWALEIINDPPASDQEIITAISKIHLNNI